MQEEWEQLVSRLFASLPVVLDDDVEKEKEYAQALKQIRAAFAQRWIDLMRARKHLPSERFDATRDRMEAYVAGLKELHGHDMLFGLDMPQKILQALPSQGDLVTW